MLKSNDRNSTNPDIIPSLMKSWQQASFFVKRKILQDHGGFNYEKTFFHTNFSNCLQLSAEKYLHVFPPAIRHKTILKKKEALTPVKVEASHFKMRPSSSFLFYKIM